MGVDHSSVFSLVSVYALCGSGDCIMVGVIVHGLLAVVLYLQFCIIKMNLFLPVRILSVQNILSNSAAWFLSLLWDPGGANK